MSFLEKVLEPPSYGYTRDGKLYVPTVAELFRETFSRVNIFKTKKNWLPLLCWMVTVVQTVPLLIFVFFFFSWPLFVAGFIYSMVILGTHGTIWYHRYSTHRAYQFKNRFWRFITQNLVIKVIPEEIYVVSHHVHHAVSDEPGDPYNVHGGWWYCFLADAVHQPINRDLREPEYRRVAELLKHTGIYLNTYEQYKKWGSVSNPYHTLATLALNWTFWFGVFYLMGGYALVMAMFGSAGVWVIGVRTFNFDGHGGGKDKRKDGVDFDRKDLSINQLWPGLVTGEWHNNHHLYPNGARAGFQRYQLDYAWYYIKVLHSVGGVVSYRDFKDEFMTKYFLPYQEAKGQKHSAAYAGRLRVPGDV